MKNITIVLSLVLLLIFAGGNLFAQSSRLLKGAERSYDDGISAYKKKKYSEASESLIIAVENISENVSSRRYQLIRLDAASRLVDIHFNMVEDLRKACKYLEIFTNDLNEMKNDNELKAKDIHKYLEMEKDFSRYKRKCSGLDTIDDKKKDFEKKFDEE